MEATAISNEELQNHIFRLPKDCFMTVMKLTSTQDVCRSAAVCTTFQSLLDSDDMWEHFLPTDLSSILSRADMDNNQLPLNKKELYLHLCHNWIDLDGGLKSFGLDLSSGAKKMMLPEKSLLIFDSRETAIPMFWTNGTINCKDLSREMNYAAYLIFTGMRYSGPEVHHDLLNNGHNDHNLISTLVQVACRLSKNYERLCTDMSSGWLPPLIYRECEKGVWQESPMMREDGQWEIKLGKFSTSCWKDGEINFYFFDDNTKLLKSELNVTGVEIRPEEVKIEVIN